MITFKHVIRFFHSLFFPKKHLITITDLKIHFINALLCMINRGATMEEYHCNEHDLFEHPEWLLKHYFENSGVCLNEREQNILLEYLKNRLGEQVAQSYTCPINIMMTIEEYKCSFSSFLDGKNHDLLISHYIRNRGAEKFAELRAKDKKERLLKDAQKVKK